MPSEKDNYNGLEDRCDLFGPEENVLFVGRRQREYLVRLIPGSQVRLKGESFAVEEIIGLPVGSSIVTPQNQAYLALRPTLVERIMNMPRAAQIIYPKDLALILLWADIRPGAKVVEIGVGHGAMTMALVRAVGPEGSVVSYEIRQDFARRTQGNLRRFIGSTPWWRIKLANPAEAGLDETGQDAIIVDMPTPWEVAGAIIGALAPGGTAIFFLPNVPQVVRLVEELKSSGKFAHFETMESILRPWRIEERSVRPEMQMAGHTGFITKVRRKLGEVVRLKRTGA
ncbi:MAG: hypothetical protein JRC92_11205 [Deltaproteobacteria bacterium]|nr:hypothetical protein [Deltaproteobacteria bacterium]